MSTKLITDRWFFDYMACPDCGAGLQILDEISCSNCQFRRVLESIEYKPNVPKFMAVSMPRLLSFDPEAVLSTLNTDNPRLTYDGPNAIRDSRELISELQRYLKPGDKVLDLGCGPKDQAVPIAHLEYKYVGIDYSNLNADLLADAHAIPFCDNTFDCILSYAVLEHLHNPIIAISEIKRVLKPGGIYVGTVSQGEPFHDSYFHHTAWGIISLSSAIADLRLIRIWPSYDTLTSLATMSRYPKIIRYLISLVDKIHRSFPILAPRKLKWSDKEKRLDRIHRAGSLCFVIQKSKKS